MTFDFFGGAWAQLRAVDATELAVLPDGVDFDQAAALPVAAVTALRALRRFGSVLGRRILVTGAAGGVGASPCSWRRSPVRTSSRPSAAPAAATGSRSSVRRKSLCGVEGLSGPLHGVLDNVGGPNQVAAFGLLAEVAPSSPSAPLPAAAVYPPYATVGPQRRLEAS